MADDASTAATSKVKFGFARKIETKIHATSTNGTIHADSIEVTKSVEFITTVEDSTIILQDGVKADVRATGELIIPLIRSRKTTTKPRPITVEAVVSVEDANAAAEILKDVEKLQNGVEEG